MPIDQITDAIRRVLNEGSRAGLITVAQSARLAVGGKMLVKANRETVGDLGDTALNRIAVEQASAFLTAREDAKMLVVSEFAPELPELANTSLLFERIETEPHLVIAGAGHVGASLARLAALIGYRVTLIDDRAEFVTRELFSATSEANIELISASDWAGAIKEAIGNGHGVAVAIVTRGHKQDEECLRAASSASPDYIGMIGSKRRTNIVLDKLREEGFDETGLKRVRAPIGLDIGAVSPEEVALAILAEIVAERRGGLGGSLSSWRRAALP
ncbi:MAG TPA: XdhC family protein [Pyrinomonadaceae bacterium]|nr:XdhC family protein [Pyrinomonadaceae bacterium]